MYILDEQRCPAPCSDPVEWKRWREAAEIDVAQTEFVDGSELWTSFVGLDQGASEGPPLVFESLLMSHTQGDEWELTTVGLYATWREAEAGHWLLVDRFNSHQFMVPIRKASAAGCGRGGSD